MTAPEQALLIEPSELLRFNGPFSEIVTCELSLKNPTDGPVAFKVKTTAPRRYAVRPNSGILQAGEAISVSVMRQPFEYDPNEKMKHKFMIQSLKVTPGQELGTVWQDADPRQMMDTRLRVVFDDSTPSNRSSITDEEYHRVRDENERLSKEVDQLKEERGRLRQLAMGGNFAGVSVTLPKGISLIFHEKKNVILIIILLILFFITGVLLADKILSQAENTAGL